MADEVVLLAEDVLLADVVGAAVVEDVDAAGVTVELEAVVVLVAFSSLAVEQPDNPATDRAASAETPTVTPKLRFMGPERTGGGSQTPATS